MSTFLSHKNYHFSLYLVAQGHLMWINTITEQSTCPGCQIDKSQLPDISIGRGKYNHSRGRPTRR
jgi:hypothetical protein